VLKPSQIQLHKKSKTLEITFGHHSYTLPAEFLRVHSPSAEVRGHGPGQEILVEGKVDVGIEDLQLSGNYGVQIIFDDGHDSGIFSWTYLKELGENHETLWKTYLDKLKDAGRSRDPHVTVVQFLPS
jgi:DUF971 family protein